MGVGNRAIIIYRTDQFFFYIYEKHDLFIKFYKAKRQETLFFFFLFFQPFSWPISTYFGLSERIGP